MSCHSTPANVALIGFHSRAFELDRSIVEGEFHWLKKVGREHAVSPPSHPEWEEFLMRQEKWVRHEPSLTEARKAKTLARLRESYDQVPDGQTYYALTHLTARLSHVTSPQLAQEALDKALRRINTLSQGSENKSSPLAAAESVEHLLTTLSRLKRSCCREPHKDSILGGADASASVRLDQMSKAEVYDVYRSAIEAIKGLRRRK